MDRLARIKPPTPPPPIPTATVWRLRVPPTLEMLESLWESAERRPCFYVACPASRWPREYR